MWEGQGRALLLLRMGHFSYTIDAMCANFQHKYHRTRAVEYSNYVSDHLFYFIYIEQSLRQSQIESDGNFVDNWHT